MLTMWLRLAITAYCVSLRNQNGLQVVVSAAAGRRTGTSEQRAGLRHSAVVTARSGTSGIFWSSDREKRLFTGRELAVVNEGIHVSPEVSVVHNLVTSCLTFDLLSAPFPVC